MTRSQRRPMLAVAALGLLAAAGCGTTVSGTAATAGGTTDRTGGLLAPAPGSVPGGAAPTGAAAGGTTGSGLGSGAVGSTPGGTGTSNTGTGSTGTASGGSGTTAAMGPGVTAHKILVGLIWPKNQDAVNQAAGAGGISVGDTKADAQAIVDDINAHGGIAGRKIEPVFQPVDSTSAQTQDTQFAAACDHFTHDERVFAVVGTGPASYQSCLAKAGIAQLDESLPSLADSDFAQNPALVELGYPKLSRIAKAQLDALAHQKYFSPWNARTGGPAPTGKAKVGILSIDDPGYSAVVNSILTPGLKQLRL